jgi:hypothetical protein
MLESKIQARLIKKYKQQGFLVFKIIKASEDGVFDLLLIDKQTLVASWVEVKAPNGEISPLQKLFARKYRALGGSARFVTENDQDFPEEIELPKADF